MAERARHASGLPSGVDRPGSSGGRLFVVATPIGNLGDLAPRTLETLSQVPLVAAEDTRLSRRLFARSAGPVPRLVSFHARNAERRLSELLAHLEAGGDLALVTDAGTPAVSDPGADLVAAWHERGGLVSPIAGPSAVTAAVSATGIAGPRWVFEGFLPRKGRLRKARLAALAGDVRGAVLFEAPDRLVATLRDMIDACGGARRAAVCRELTKLHEQIVVAPLADLGQMAADGRIAARGELVIVLGMDDGPAAEAATDAVGDSERLAAARAEVARLVAAGAPRVEAAKRVAKASGLPRRALYGG